VPSWIKHPGLSNGGAVEGGDPVELSTGNEIYTPGQDIVAFNPIGPEAKFERSWRSYDALAGINSEGLGRGWRHNYDFLIRSPEPGIFDFVGNGQDIVTFFAQSSNGQSTGQFQNSAGVPYRLVGDPTSSPNVFTALNLTYKDGTTWRFEPLPSPNEFTFRPTRITNRQGQYISLSWSGSRLDSVKNAAGANLLLLQYTGGNLTKISDNNSRAVSYLLGSSGSKSRTALAAVSQISAISNTNPPAKVNYSYTDVGPDADTLEPMLTGISVPNPTGTGTANTTISYDNNTFKVNHYIDARGNKQQFTYNANSTLVQNKDSLGNVVASYTHKFDTLGRSKGVIDALGNQTSIDYTDTVNRYLPTSVTDPDNRVTSYAYNGYGNMTSMVNPRGVTTTYTYNYTYEPWGWVTSIQTGTLEATTYSYYTNGLLQSITMPRPGSATGTVVSSFSLDADGNILSTIGPGNNAGAVNTTNYYYTTDGSYTQPMVVGKPIRIVDSTGKDVHIRYDSLGRVISKWDALGNTETYQYNLAGQRTVTTYPATGQTGAGNGTDVTNYLYVGGPVISSLIYNESGTQIRQLTTQYDALGQVIGVGGNSDPRTYTYDAANRLKTQVDGNGQATTYNYDVAGRISSTVYPGSETTTVNSYSASGQILQSTEPNGTVKNFVYGDPEGLLTAINYPASSAQNTSYSYDSLGRLSSVTDGAGTYGYTYGRLSEVATQTVTYTGLPARTFTYGYYPDGSRSSLMTPLGNFSYNFDLAGRMTSMTNPNAETTSWAYYNNGWLQQQTVQSGFKNDFAYNALGRVTSLVNQTSANVVRSSFGTFAYDGTGNQTGVTVTNPGSTTYGGTIANAFNTRDELTQQVSTIAGGYNHSFAYDNAGNATTVRGTARTYNTKNQLTGTGFVYNANGNPTTYAGTVRAFDPEDRLTTSGTYTAGYRQDNLRAWRQNGTTRTYFLYDGDQPIFEMSSTGALTATNTFGVNGLISRRTGTTTVYYAYDASGNTYQRISSAQAVLSNHRVDAYGTTTSDVTTTSDPFRGRGAKFGYYWENTPGMYVTGQRYYDPANARFLTRDPISHAGGPNLYRYASGNPASYVDPSGLFSVTASDGGERVQGFMDSTKDVVTDRLASNPLGVIAATGINTGIDFFGGMATGYLSMGVGLGNYFGGCGSLGEAVLDGAGIILSAAGAGATAKGITGALKAPLCKITKRGCFVAGTLILLANGASKPIEDIKVGDTVVSRSDQYDDTSPVVASKVTKVFSYEIDGTLLVKFADGSIIETTSEHPFYVHGEGFIPAKNLSVGKQISEADHSLSTVTSLVRLSEPRLVYNFEVSDTGTYFVKSGINLLWVHNAPLGCTPEKHHPIPQELSKDMPNLVGDPMIKATVPMPANIHRGKGGLHSPSGGNYNKWWKDRVNENGGVENITPEQVEAIRDRAFVEFKDYYDK
jgi:RHS repeat-associated protein